MQPFGVRYTFIRARYARRRNGHPKLIEMDTKTCGVDNFCRPHLASVIVCLRWIQETPTTIDIRNRGLAEEARDFGDSTPAIAKLSPAAAPGRGRAGSDRQRRRG